MLLMFYVKKDKWGILMKNNRKKSMPADKEVLFKSILEEVRKGSRFDLSDNYIQHGNTSVKKHCVNVAYTAFYMSYKMGVRVDERQLIRGALLHDYFLYDWHEKSIKNSIHGYTHGSTALKEAKKDFDLSLVEQDMIKHHMFPLTPKPPKSIEGIMLCIADKVCAIKETINRK